MHARPPVGLLIAQSTRTDAAGLRAALTVGGIPILIRQMRQLQALGVDGFLVLGAAGEDALHPRIEGEARRLGAQVEWSATRDRIAALSQDRSLLVINDGLVIDERLLAPFNEAAALAEPAAPLLGQWSGQGGMDGGVVFLPAGSLDRVRFAALRPNQPLSARMLAEVGMGQPARFDFSNIDSYSPPRRRRVSLLWRQLSDAPGARSTTTELLAAAQKGCLDWPARFLHPPIENLLTRLLLPTPITPNMLSVTIFLLGLYAAWLFASGAVWPALLLALLIGPLDGVDGKLARTRYEFSPWGDLEHVGDKIVEYLWYVGIAVWLETAWAWAVAALIVFFALAEALQGEIFRRLAGTQLDDAGPIERRFRLVSGRRNTFLWTLVPFGLAEAWAAGFIMIAAYAVLTFFFVQWRFYARLSTQFREDPGAIERNVARTGYAFLPEKVHPAE
ncbi:MAG: CDP-alcohol phosphatidyltransferase family protein [Novosphingobium sp.]|jgi:phosphatidylglycerophosphate synthase